MGSSICVFDSRTLPLGFCCLQSLKMAEHRFVLRKSQSRVTPHHVVPDEAGFISRRSFDALISETTQGPSSASALVELTQTACILSPKQTRAHVHMLLLINDGVGSEPRVEEVTMVQRWNKCRILHFLEVM